MQVIILSVSVSTTPTAKGSYQSAEIAYKAEDGAIKGKKIMSFGPGAPAFKLLSKAQAGEVYDVTPVKNDKDFWDWTDVKKLDGSSEVKQETTSSYQNTTKAPAGKVVGSNYPTSDERADTQRYIVRQSSVANAVKFLDKEESPTVEAVISVAKEFEAYVFGKESKPVTDFSDMQDDVPL